MIQLATRSRLIDKGLNSVLFLAMLTTVVTSLLVVFLLGKESFVFFQEVSIIDFLFGTRWEPLLEPKSFGVLPLVSGTFLIVLGSTVIALPAGLMVAIYLNEYANYRVRAFVKPALELLAGIPTVVYGYFALTFITPVVKAIYPDIQVFNAFSGAVVVGIMILPMVSSLVDDAFRGVPKALREGAYAMGAKPVEVTVQVILPAIRSRITAAVILAVSRAIGETMAVTLAAGATAKMTLNPFESIQTMTAYIVQVSLGDTPHGGIEYQTCFAVAALLFVMTLIMNMLGNKFMFIEKKKVK